jgi:hypothetical protein
MNEIIRELSNMLLNRVVITCEEIERKAIRAIIKAKSIEALTLEEELIKEVVKSYVECPISLQSFHYSEKIEVENIAFYHLHTSKPSKADYEKAYAEFLISKQFLDSYGKMKSIADEFFKDHGLRKGIVREYFKDKYRYAVFYSLLEDISEDLQAHLKFASKYSAEYVIITPSEKTPEPFINFFQKYSEQIKAANIKIWVADVDKASIDPFIGYPKDFKLLKRFKNPKLATHIESLWRTKIEKID